MEEQQNSIIYSSGEFEEYIRQLDAEHNIELSETLSNSSLGQTWREFEQRSFPHTEKLIFGLSYGQVGMTVAQTNVGKTTFALNVAVMMAVGETYEPFVKAYTGGRRVAFIDGENTQAELQAELRCMMRGWSELKQDVVRDNLLIMCDEEIAGQSLTLDNRQHMNVVKAKLQDFNPALIVVDTLSALFNLGNENDNAEIKRRVIAPLKELAKAANSVVWLQHHIGKMSEEARTNSNAYLGRGGSNLGALSRAVIVLKADKSDCERVTVSVAKAKGFRLDDTVMRLDPDSRWFTVQNETPPVVQTPYNEIVAFVTRRMRTADIKEAFRDRYSTRTIEDNLKSAVARGDLQRLQHGWYEPQTSADSTQPYENCGSCGNDNT